MNLIKSDTEIQSMIYTGRGTQVMLDRDLAILYGVETKRVNEAVRNNADKFPNDFYFEVTEDEFLDLRTKVSTANFSKTRTAPKVFTEQGIFFDGQIFDAYVFASELIRSAKSSLVLIDNYVDESVLTLLSKRELGCKATIYTKTISRELELDLKKHNGQYPPIVVRHFRAAHDRFLIIDERSVYHIGASLKDLGKKWFAFSKFDKEALRLLEKLDVV